MTYLQFNSWVTHERLDDEVIAINLETGAYYALAGPAADVWTLAAGGGSTDEIVAELDARYDADTDMLRRDIDAFVGELVEQGLAAATDDAPAPGHDVAKLPAAAASAQPYAAPSLTRYDDLADLLLLDPIHEVDDAGWPIARAE